jgi:hypothetical protein
MSSEEHELLWKGQPVGILRDVALVDWPWVGGTLIPRGFPKDLADALVWTLSRDDHDDSPDDLWPDESVWEGWSVRRPDGTVVEIMIGHIDFTDGDITWR